MSFELLSNTSSLAQLLPPTPKDRLERSCKRSYKFTANRIKNISYAPQVWAALQSLGDCSPLNSDQDYTPEEISTHAVKVDAANRLGTYKKNLCVCGGRSLYRKRVDGREATLITSLTCNHRLCNICNMLRATKMRRRWGAFFKSSERNVFIRKKHLHMFQDVEVDVVKAKGKLISLDGDRHIDEETGEVVESKGREDQLLDMEPRHFTSGLDLLKNFDFMHLTLTVPHGPQGWNGKRYYAKELIAKFNEMRKARWWQEMVFGGEMSVETTRSVAGGLHIHIHAMILVDKRIGQSRNKLHEEILKRWNHLTIDETRPESEKKVDVDSVEGRIRWDGIHKSLGKPGDKWMHEWMEKNFDARGSSLIGLKSLYYEITPTEAALRTRSFEQNGKHYAYASSRYAASMVKGVMECLKYHFEPCVLENSDGELDTDFLIEVLPNIYRQRLYGKFGGFYGVTQLNVAEDPLNMADMMEDLADTAGEEAFDPATGAPIERRDYLYVVCDAAKVIFVHKKHLCYLDEKNIKKTMEAGIGISNAMQELAHWGYKGEGRDG